MIPIGKRCKGVFFDAYLRKEIKMNTLDKYLRNVKLNYLYTAVTNFNLAGGFWMIFLASKGLSLVWLGILEGVFHVTSLLMETPTGAIADIMGRKFSRQLSILFSILYIVILLNGTETWHFIIGFVFCALGYNLESGAGDALIYDSLKENGKEKEFTKISGIREVFFQASVGIGIAVGGYLAVINYNLPYLIMIGIAVIAFVISCFFTEVPIPNKKEHIHIWAAIKDQYVTSFNFVKNNKKALFLSIVLNVTGMFVLIGFFYMQNYWKDMGISESVIGLCLGLHSGFAAVGGYFAHKLEKRMGEKKIIIFGAVVLAAIYWLLYFPAASFVAIILVGFIDSMLFVVLSSYINHLIPSEQRATLLSFSSMMFSMMMIAIFPVVGFMGDKIGLANAFLILAIILNGLTIAIVYKVLKDKETVKL